MHQALHLLETSGEKKSPPWHMRLKVGNLKWKGHVKGSKYVNMRFITSKYIVGETGAQWGRGHNGPDRLSTYK